jgi:hypothetical protein
VLWMGMAQTEAPSLDHKKICGVPVQKARWRDLGAQDTHRIGLYCTNSVDRLRLSMSQIHKHLLIASFLVASHFESYDHIATLTPTAGFGLSGSTLLALIWTGSSFSLSTNVDARDVHLRPQGGRPGPARLSSSTKTCYSSTATSTTSWPCASRDGCLKVLSKLHEKWFSTRAYSWHNSRTAWS